ncbi:MAG: methyltransferase domain-containing protein [Firmicutes bacterium]|nr:methyltransferase domain-containing protein [Bacillota bacterium]MBU4533630.1 methyltransferase domain-containing protein [Bacillota bacterium]MBV1726590.1 methyltransferase domain-containing protein [Desulforudis sp.]MBV1734834.1 methyltransferase domain-containing protein [Desulforudis sp.]
MWRIVENRLWQLYARVYDTILLRFLPYRRLLRVSAEALNSAPGWKVLDAGCGTGNLTSHIARTRPETLLTAVDFAPAMLRRAARKVKNNSKVTVRQVDLNRLLPFAESEFDAVVCVNVLYAVEDPERLLRELNRVLKPNGRFVLVNPANQPKMRFIVQEHISELRLSQPLLWPFLLAGQVLRTLPQLLVFTLVNAHIQRQQEYHFYSVKRLVESIGDSGFKVIRSERVYGEQCWFMICAKEFTSRGIDTHRERWAHLA